MINKPEHSNTVDLHYKKYVFLLSNSNGDIKQDKRKKKNKTPYFKRIRNIKKTIKEPAGLFKTD